jgi:hypothetical protein
VPIFRQAIRHQDGIHHFLTGLGVDLEKATVARSENIVMVGFERDG